MIALILVTALEIVAIDPPRGVIAAPILAPPQPFFAQPAACADNHAPDEVTICGRKDRDARYRLKPIDDKLYAEKSVRATTQLGDGTLDAHVEDKELGGGIHSKRAMIRFTIPF